MDDYICPEPIKSYDVRIKKKMEWISVKDRLPENENEVLIWDGNYIEMGFMEYEDKTPVSWRNIEMIENNHISHWMPLPIPPEE